MRVLLELLELVVVLELELELELAPWCAAGGGGVAVVSLEGATDSGAGSTGRLATLASGVVTVRSTAARVSGATAAGFGGLSSTRRRRSYSA